MTNAGEAGNGCAARDTEQQGFGLVVGGMAGGNQVQVAALRGPEEEVAPDTAGGHFQRFSGTAFLRDRKFAGDQRQAEPTGESGDKSGIGRGGAAPDAVVDVGEDQFHAQLVQGQRQRDGIRAAADGNQNALAAQGRQARGQGVLDRRQHGRV